MSTSLSGSLHVAAQHLASVHRVRPLYNEYYTFRPFQNEVKSPVSFTALYLVLQDLYLVVTTLYKDLANLWEHMYWLDQNHKS